MIFICEEDRVYFYEYAGIGTRPCPICGQAMFSHHGTPPEGFRSIPRPIVRMVKSS